MRQVIIGFVALGATSTIALGGAFPSMGGEMKHIFVTLSGNTIFLAVQGDPAERVELLRYDESYAAPADVLDDAYYAGRFGWLAQGFWAVPPGRGIFVEVVDQPVGLRTYGEFDYQPILGTEGASLRWQWSTSMTHNWYAADRCGKYQATYKVYVGDAVTGDADPAYVAAFITLYWQVVPDENFGDVDEDGDVDLQDFSMMQTCFTGVTDPDMPSDCGCFDFDGDDDVDDSDFDVFEAMISAP